ncbi:MAG TPA: ABC transporter permease [Vicinamibacterales bacterium]|nr:ABC transporter permease [Vicinamibacterales bacterium]
MSWRRSSRRPRINDELRFHRDRVIDDYVAAGMDRQAAERRAFLEFGNAVAIEESVRDVRGRWLDDLSKDLTYAIRTLRRTPVFTTVAVLSLALGIGANAAIFSLINAVMLRSLPVEEPDRLVRITRMREGRPGTVSYPVFERFRDHIAAISGAFVQQRTSEQTVSVGGSDETVAIDFVSGSYFIVLGLEPAAGRLLEPADDVESPASPAAVISDRYWLRRFGRSPNAIGTTFTLRARVFTIVGVMPPSYRGARPGTPPDVVAPLLPMMPARQRVASDFNNLLLLARLKPGATVEQARAEAEVLYRPIAEAQAAESSSRQERAAMLRQRVAAFHAPDGFNTIREEIGEPLLLLMAIVGLILLLACVNVSGLLLARAAARQREISIRVAIGAGRGRLVRQFLTESLVLAAFGGALGFAVAGRASERLFSLFVNGRPIDFTVSPDMRVLALTALVTLVASLAAGLVPAVQAFRVRLNPALKEVPAHGHSRLGKSLVVVQFAISMVLVVGATLFVGTLVKLYAVDRGFDTRGLIALQVRADRPYPRERNRVIQQSALEGLRSIPDVRSASAGAILPVGGGLWDRNVRVEGHASQTAEPEMVAFNAIAPQYFTTLGTPLREGREFEERDTVSAPFVAIVNESFARSFFGERSAIGRHVTTLGLTYEIVGVVGNAKYQGLREGTLRTLYVPWTQLMEDQSFNYLMRLEGDASRLAQAVQRVLRDADPGLRVFRLMTYDAWIDEGIPTERLMATIGGLVGLLALVLAAVGMFGALAFQVTRRTNEFGVRNVLGATRWSMIRLVLGDVAAIVVPGVVIGGGIALMLTGLARSLLFGLTPTEPRVFALAAVILCTAALLAGWVPARRASSVDPLVALRHE